MKKTLLLSFFGCLLFCCSHTLQAQQQEQKENPNIKTVAEEEEGPAMFKFEPNFLATAEQRKARIDHARKILDTLDISERRRRKLLKDLYKNGVSERLSKTLYADTKYEDIVD